MKAAEKIKKVLTTKNIVLIIVIILIIGLIALAVKNSPAPLKAPDAAAVTAPAASDYPVIKTVIKPGVKK